VVAVKGNSEFIYFLVAGLIILAVLLSIFGTGAYTGGCGTNCPVNLQQPGVIEVVKTYDVPGFVASNLLQRMSTDEIDKTVFSGLLFGEDKIRYDISRTNLQDITVRFTVTETNYYGRLFVRVNDQVVEAMAYDPGTYTVVVPAELISDHSVVEIAAENSYWKIWAPTVYSLADVQIGFTSYFSETSQFKFYLGEEYINLEFSKVDIILSENVGTLLVDINGRNIWSSPVANQQSIILEKSDLRLGDNIIKFRAAPDSTFRGRAAIVVVYLSQYPEAINQTGVVTAAQPLVGQSSQFYSCSNPYVQCYS
jgi:hypothetical protein